MSFAFEGKAGPILLEAEVPGPTSPVYPRLLFDTGATHTIISPAILRRAGYEQSAVSGSAIVTTGNGVIQAPRLILTRFTAFGQHRFGFPVLAHDLSADAGIDGLLGLDFLRGLRITLDFRAGVITLD